MPAAAEPIWEKFYNQLESRMVTVEREHDALRVENETLRREGAVRDEQYRNIIGRLSSLENTISRLTWIIIGTVIVAGLSFVVRGYVGH